MRASFLPLLVGVLAVPACHPVEWHDLQPYPNPFGPDDPQWAEQPHRDNPLEIAVAGDLAYVSLQGSPDIPGDAVAVVDWRTGDVLDRVPAGSSPTGLAASPDGKLVVAFNRFSDHATVIDAEEHREIAEVPAEYYDIEGAFTPDGRELWITNRWRDSVEIWDVDTSRGTLDVLDRDEPGVPVGTNPRDVAVSADGQTVAVACPTGMTVSLIDVPTRTERVRIQVGAPANGVAFAGDFLVVPTMSASTHHQPLDGPDTNGDGVPGDGTPNVNFQDLQDEIAVYRVSDGAEVHRYTSDTICCKDFRDVDPDDVARHGDLLQPREDWIVGGAVPEQVAVDDDPDGPTAWVTYSGSDQLQSFRMDPATGALTPGPVWDAGGHNPHGIALAGDRVLVAHRLGETLGILDASTGDVVAAPVVGDVSGGAFPATDAEVGELVNFVTAPFTVDGDQACAGCHREGSNIDKALSMPLTRYPGVGSRMVQAYRGAADSRPWFFETAMDQTNFRPVLNEFARAENFCCSDFTLWPNGAPADCETNPPPECQDDGPGSADGFVATRDGGVVQHARPTPYASRDAFYLAAAQKVIGRTESYGDAVYYEDPVTGERSPMSLTFDGITRSLGAFLLIEPGLLPNPNDPDTAQVKRGKAIFERPDVGCSQCHPSPSFAVSTDVNPSGLPLRVNPVVSPMRREDGVNLDLLADGFMTTFPESEQDACTDVCPQEVCDADPSACDDVRNVRFGVVQLRGIWDRAPSMLHDGRAKSLREVVCTPGHPALQDGETGYNERDGIPNTHGSTSQLSPEDIDDLIAYLRTL